MKKIARNFVLVLAVSVVSGLLGLFTSQDVSASSEDLYKKAILGAVYECYRNDTMQTSVNVDDYQSFAKSILKVGKNTDPKYYIPTGVGDTYAANNRDGTKVGCYELFLGNGKMSGVFKAYGKETDEIKKNTSGLHQFLPNIGFTQAEATGAYGATKDCISISSDPKMSGESEPVKGSVCWDDAYTATDITKGADFASHATVKLDDSSDSRMKVTVTGSGDAAIASSVPGIGDILDDLVADVCLKFEWKSDGLSAAQTRTICGGPHDGKFNYTSIVDIANSDSEFRDGWPKVYTGSVETSQVATSASELTEVANTYKRAKTGGYSDLTKYLADGQIGRRKFTDTEKYELYSVYMSDVYKIKEPSDSDCQENKPNAAIETDGNAKKYWIKTNKGWCRVRPGSDNRLKKKVSGFSDSDYMLDIAYDFEGLVKAMFKLNPEDSVLISPDGVTAEERAEEAEKAENDPCYTDSGVLSWFVCPIIKVASDALSSAYDKWIEPLLATSSGIVSALQVDGNNGVYSAWSLFRNIANILFIIMFLIVIFSQLTGIGIDNYGIKRILPRLIVTAILVNFSFLICQLAVDLSNILGVGLKNLMVQFANDNVSIAVSSQAKPTFGNGTLTSVGGVIEMLVLGFAAGAAAYQLVGFAFIAPVVLALVGALVAVFFGFVLLGARQAAILILVVTSPVAFILYMLPNTNKLFQKWSKLFVDLLLVFPAVGLLIGGCYFASRVILLIDSDSFIFQLVGLILLCVPYFFIIPLVRGSLNAIGNIGTQIQNLGRNLNRNVGGAVRNSDAYKSLQAQARTAGTKGFGRKGRFSRSRIANSGFGRFVGLNRSLSRQNQAWEKMQNDDIEAAAYLDASVNPDGSVETLMARINDSTISDSERDAVARRLSNIDGGKTLAKELDKKFFNPQFDMNSDQGAKDLSWAQKYMQRDTNLSKQMAGVSKPTLEFISSNGAKGSMFKRNDQGQLLDKQGQVIADDDKDMNEKVAANTDYGGRLGMDEAATMSTHAFRQAVQGGWFDNDMVGDMLDKDAPDRIKQRIANDPERREVAMKYGNAQLRYSDGTAVVGANGSAARGKMPSSDFVATGAFSKGTTVYLEDVAGNVWDTSKGQSVDSLTAASLKNGAKILRNSNPGDNSSGGQETFEGGAGI